MANTKMGMTEEMMNDTLDDILTERLDIRSVVDPDI